MTPVSADKPAPPFMRSEEDIFAFLGLQYVAPTARVDGSQIRSVSRPPTPVIVPSKSIKLKLKKPTAPEPEPEPLPEPVPPVRKLKLKLKKE
jgi:hypothetical protein